MSEDEIVHRQNREVGDLDLHVGDAVTIDVSSNEAGIIAQFAGDVGEGGAADEGKGLVARRSRIGVNGCQIDPVT